MKNLNYAQATLIGDPSLIKPTGWTFSNNVSNPNTRLDFRSGLLGGEAVVIWNSNKYLARQLPSTTTTKRLDQLWVQGNNNGGRFSGAVVSPNQTWFLFIMRNNTSGAIDFGFSMDPTGSDAPPSWSVSRIGVWLTDAGANLVRLIHFNNEYKYMQPVPSFVGSISSAGALYSLDVPLGIEVQAMIYFCGGWSNDTNIHFYASEVEADNAEPIPIWRTTALAHSSVYSAGSSPFMQNSDMVLIKTNTSRQIRARKSLLFGSEGTGIYTPSIKVVGWKDLV